jgi:type II secretory pathway pseudopilin PulG
LVDVLVTISVIAVLIGLLIPGLAGVTESARRVACQSNVRQIGLALVMYTNDYNGQLPRSRYIAHAGQTFSQQPPSAEKMVTVRLPASETDPADRFSAWDGLGLLYCTEYLDAAKVFYCPSHRGESPYSSYARAWAGAEGEIVCNFHFRGEGPTTRLDSATGRRFTTTVLWNIDPAQSSLIADSMRSQRDYNHTTGVNFFRADLSVHWFDDPEGSIRETLPESKDQPGGSTAVNDAWNALDSSANNNH